MHKITPFLWFDGRAEEAMKFYTSIFKNSRIISTSYWGEGTPYPKDQVKMGTFELDGQRLYAFDAGPHFKFTEAISFFIECQTQEEVDYFWEKLSDGGEKSQCGWLKDRFGLSWQVVPEALGRYIQDQDKVKAQKVMEAMMKMQKLDIAELEAAYRS
ncbi:MAG TPA: VOC family protein [Flavisolibacter sp.]